MRTSKQAKRDAKELFRSCQVDGLLDETRVRTAVEEMLARKPRGYMDALQFFLRLVKLDVDRRSALVESPQPLPTDLQTAVQSNLSRLYGRGLAVRFAQNPALVGGMRIRVGSDVYDGTILGRLEQLQESF